MKITCCNNFMNFQFAIELLPNFKYLQIIYEKIILKFVIHSIAFARADTNFPVVREITRIKKSSKRIILE